jgi:hypothetical protein
MDPKKPPEPVKEGGVKTTEKPPPEPAGEAREPETERREGGMIGEG